jgi:hypothetical protein
MAGNWENAVFRLALGLALAAATPAYAADPATLDCVQKTVTPEARKGLEADIERNLSHPDQEQTYAPAVVAGLRAAAATCQTQFKWSDAAAQAAILYSVPTLGITTAQRMAASNKLDYAALERRFMALPAGERRDAINESVLSKLAAGAIEAGEIVEANANVAGGIFGLLAVREKARNDFAGN